MPQERAPVSVKGLAQLRSDLRTIDPVILRALRKELKGAGEVIKIAAQELAPVRSGALRDSLKVSTAGDRVRIGSELPYSALIHWGGNDPSSRSSSSRTKRYFKPHPFIEQAALSNAEALGEAILDGIDRALRSHLK